MDEQLREKIIKNCVGFLKKGENNYFLNEVRNWYENDKKESHCPFEDIDSIDEFCVNFMTLVKNINYIYMCPFICPCSAYGVNEVVSIIQEVLKRLEDNK